MAPIVRSARRARVVIPAVCLLLGAATLLGGCDSEASRLEAFAAQAATNRAAAAASMTTAWRGGQITFDGALTAAHDRLAAGEDAAGFGGAVLDLAVGIEDVLPSGAEHELLWMRIGRLAFASALAAYNAGRLDEARALVLAGPKRWQNDPYWLRYPDHDALASIILAQTGDRAEAIRRLHERPNLTGDAEEALRLLQGGR